MKYTVELQHGSMHKTVIVIADSQRDAERKVVEQLPRILPRLYPYYMPLCVIPKFRIS